MKVRILYCVCALLLMTAVMQSCKAGKGCGCGNNLNHYDPKRGR